MAPLSKARLPMATAQAAAAGAHAAAWRLSAATSAGAASAAYTAARCFSVPAATWRTPSPRGSTNSNPMLR